MVDQIVEHFRFQIPETIVVTTRMVLMSLTLFITYLHCLVKGAFSPVPPYCGILSPPIYHYHVVNLNKIQFLLTHKVDTEDNYGLI